MPRRRLPAALALATALMLAPALSGCGAIEGLIEQASGGELDVSMGSLPSGWPDEVPVIDGDILIGGTTTGSDDAPGWNATIKVDGTSAMDEIRDQLEGAGFEKLDTGELAGSDAVASGAFKNDRYGVFVAVTGADDNYVANYTVVEGDPVTE
jgi:hypothetical protein